MGKTKGKIDELLPQLEIYYEKDPDKFEAIKNEIIKETIESFPEKFQQRAYGIQFTLDCELRKYKNPVARMNRMVEIFWYKVAEFQDVLNDPTSKIADYDNSKTSGKVIPLFRS